MRKPARSEIAIGDLAAVDVHDRKTRNNTIAVGHVHGILTRSETHPHGIKVRLNDGTVGRVMRVFPAVTIVPCDRTQA